MSPISQPEYIPANMLIINLLCYSFFKTFKPYKKGAVVFLVSLHTQKIETKLVKSFIDFTSPKGRIMYQFFKAT